MTLDESWIGSISHGSLRELDLIPAFEAVLESAGVEYDRPSSVDRLLAGEVLIEGEWEEISFYLNEELFDALNEIAPKGTYFGAHPGDGSDFGFWHVDEE